MALDDAQSHSTSNLPPGRVESDGETIAPCIISPVDPRVQALRSRLDGELLLPGELGYDAPHVWSGQLVRRPLLIARCSGPADVQAAVKFACTANLIVCVRGRGPDLSREDTCQGELQIDLSHMKAISINPHQRTVRGEAGATWSELDQVTRAHDLRVTGNRAWPPGVATLTLGDGMNRLLRECGPSVVDLLSVEMILTDGTYLIAHERDHPDFFQEVRHGSCDRGVATAFRYCLHPIQQLHECK